VKRPQTGLEIAAVRKFERLGGCLKIIERELKVSARGLVFGVPQIIYFDTRVYRKRLIGRGVKPQPVLFTARSPAPRVIP